MRAALEETTQRVGRHFANPAARTTAGAYLQSLLSSVERKNSWQLAEVAGFDTPYRFQHLLGRGAWEADALRDEQLDEVLAGLGKDDAVLAIDETGFVKQGKKSVGVKRQYCGASGKIDNCQIGVFLSWQTAKGHALIDRVLYLPEDWAQDPERRRAAGVPEDAEFATKPASAREMVARALAAGARPAWVVADAVYGADYKLRPALEEGGPGVFLCFPSASRQCSAESWAARAPLYISVLGPLLPRRTVRPRRGLRSPLPSWSLVIESWNDPASGHRKGSIICFSRVTTTERIAEGGAKVYVLMPVEEVRENLRALHQLSQ